VLIQFVTALHFFVCIILVGIVLLQQGKGADMGATFGGGSNTLFGASGANSLITRITTFMACLFMVTSLFLATHARNRVVSEPQMKLFQNEPSVTTVEMPTEAPKSSEAPAELPPVTKGE